METDNDFLTFVCYLTLFYNILVSSVISLFFKHAVYNAKNGTLWLAFVIVVFITVRRFDDSLKQGTSRYLWLFPAMIPATFFRLMFYREKFGIVDVILLLVVIGWAVFFFLKAEFRFGLKLLIGIITPVVLFPMIMIVLFVNTFGITIMRYYTSPSGTYECEVALSDWGTFGGDTYARIYKTGTKIELMFENITFPVAEQEYPWFPLDDFVVDWPEDDTIIIGGNVWHWSEDI